MTQSFNTTAMPVIVDGITNSNSAFGATEEGEAVFFNTRMMQLKDTSTLWIVRIAKTKDTTSLL